MSSKLENYNMLLLWFLLSKSFLGVPWLIQYSMHRVYTFGISESPLWYSNLLPMGIAAWWAFGCSIWLRFKRLFCFINWVVILLLLKSNDEISFKLKIFDLFKLAFICNSSLNILTANFHCSLPFQAHLVWRVKIVYATITCNVANA